MARAMGVCPTKGCPNLTPGGRCPKCKGAAEQQRGTAAQRGYDAQWARNRERYLSQPEHLFCVLKAPGCTDFATVADHHPVSRRDLLAQGVRDPDAWHRLRPLCHHCHSVATAEHQPGGWAAR